MSEKHTGSCLCGGVAYTVTGPLRPVVACHCRQCRKTSGHFAAMTSAPVSAIRYDRDETLRWFASSDRAERGYCVACGGNLFWKPTGEDRISITAGTLDTPTGLSISHHIHVEDAGDYYDPKRSP
jgi:hypothetical protein